MHLIDYVLPQRAATVQQLGHPAAGVIGWEPGSLNTSGEAVTSDTAMNYSAVWCAKRVISETVACLPCILYRRTSSDGKERARDDPRYRLVHDSPNEEQGASTFFEAGTYHLVDGNSYAVIVREGNEPVSLELRQPSVVTPTRREDDSVIEYFVQVPRAIVEWPDMLHVIGLSSDGIIGESVIAKARQTIGTGIAQEKYAGSFFGNSAVPRSVLTHPQILKKEARESLRREWDETHKGSENANKIAIMHGGMDIKPLASNNEDAQFLESRLFSVAEIGRWYRLPAHFLGDLTHATFSNIEHQSLDFVKFSLLPWLKRWETALAQKLLRRQERGDLFFEFMVEGLLRADTKTRNESNAIARQWGWKSVNEIRKEENMNPVENGDVYLQPLNMAPAGEPVPDTVSTEFEKNITAMVDEIRHQAADMREGLCSIPEAERLLESKLKVLRDVNADIRNDLEQLGMRVQSMGFDACDRATEAASREFQRATSVLLKGERARVLKAARVAVNSGGNFLSLIDEFYEEWTAKVCEVLRPSIDIWCSVNGGDAAAICDSYTASHVELSKREVLEASETTLDKLESAVTSVCESWDSRTVELPAKDKHNVA